MYTRSSGVSDLKSSTDSSAWILRSLWRVW